MRSIPTEYRLVPAKTLFMLSSGTLSMLSRRRPGTQHDNRTIEDESGDVIPTETRPSKVVDVWVAGAQAGIIDEHTDELTFRVLRVPADLAQHDCTDNFDIEVRISEALEFDDPAGQSDGASASPRVNNAAFDRSLTDE